MAGMLLGCAMIVMGIIALIYSGTSLHFYSVGLIEKSGIKNFSDLQFLIWGLWCSVPVIVVGGLIFIGGAVADLKEELSQEMKKVGLVKADESNKPVA